MVLAGFERGGPLHENLYYEESISNYGTGQCGVFLVDGLTNGIEKL